MDARKTLIAVTRMRFVVMTITVIYNVLLHKDKQSQCKRYKGKGYKDKRTYLYTQLKIKMTYMYTQLKMKMTTSFVSGSMVV
jgi:hypothetical protein